jgi:DNA-binding NtrC family response regulator
VKRKILIVEDDSTLSRLICSQLRSIGYSAEGARSWSQVEEYFRNYEPHLILADVRLPDANGMEKLPWLAEQAPVIMLTAYGSVRDAVAAMHAGASEYLVKPINPDELEVVVRRVLENARIRREHQFCMARAISRRANYIIGDSPALHAMHNMLSAVAPTDMTVLIQGESGSGKELVAQAIHDLSERNKGTFVAVDCCTLQEKLFESELFGHERGAFTGADRQKKGLIEAAEGGTLFLDEIGEIEPSIQAKLLRVLETGRFRRLGGVKDLPASVRVVAATNRNLEQMSRAGEFRSDLYYRLSAFVLEVPSLRDRKKDIPALAQHFIDHHNFSRRVGQRLSQAALDYMAEYDWPGNIRELRNVVERAIILSRGSEEIAPEHVVVNTAPALQQQPCLTFEHQPTLADIERNYLGFLMEKYRGHRAKIASTMGVSERNLYRLIKKHGLN